MKGLIEKTAASLDDLALKMLFVSVQQNNLELCIKYAIYEWASSLRINYRHGYSFHFRRDNLGHSNEVCWKPGSPLVDIDIQMRPWYAGRHHGSRTACIKWVDDWRSELHFMLSKTGGENSPINGELPPSLRFAIWMQLCKSNLETWQEKLCFRMWV